MACSRLFKDKYTIRQLIEKMIKLKKWDDISLRVPKKKA